jgi:hypothetical protein
MPQYSAYDVDKTNIKVEYCINNDTKDFQFFCAKHRKLPGLSELRSPRSDQCAVVAFGPSLEKTWEQVRQYKHIMTCSGSHKFLIDKGVRPSEFENWWHVEVDPRKHKVQLLGAPQRKVQYLLSSFCHPELFDHLKKYDVKVWHVYDASVDLRLMPSVFPRGELIVTGGSNVGLRCLVLARALGFQDLSIFGMDYSFPEPEADAKIHSHAAAHPIESRGAVTATIGGRTFYTTATMIHYAREFWHELEAMPGLRVHLVGEGLLQAWAVEKMTEKLDAKDANKKSVVALILPPTISKPYQHMLTKYHEKCAEYGAHGHEQASLVQKLAISTSACSVLDYGCGKGTLAPKLSMPIWEYDPAIPGKTDGPRPADLVLCLDVLQSVEPDYLEEVLVDLARCVKKVGFFTITQHLSSLTLPDGRNANLILKSEDWWRGKLAAHFVLVERSIIKKGLHLFVTVASK